MVECNRDRLLFQKLREKGLIPSNIDVLPKHEGKSLILKASLISSLLTLSFM